MSAMASQITSHTVVYSTVYSGADQRKHQRSASLASVCGIHRWLVNSPHKGPVTRKCLHLMTSTWSEYHLFCCWLRILLPSNIIALHAMAPCVARIYAAMLLIACLNMLKGLYASCVGNYKYVPGFRWSILNLNDFILHCVLFDKQVRYWNFAQRFWRRLSLNSKKSVVVRIGCMVVRYR